jgi:diadenosine tetraphosphate (Ap4A) HIT family hydrolase
MFRLDPAFEATSIALVRLPLCEARLQNDARFPWIVLIPAQANLRELEDLAAADRARLMEEIVLAGRAVRAIDPAATKLNVGALGNITAQLHAHVVGRRPGDPSWPGPVWGFGAATPYREAELARARAAALAVLASPTSP